MSDSSHIVQTHKKLPFISTSGVYKTPFTLIIVLQLFIGSIVVFFVNLWFLNRITFLLTGNIMYKLTSDVSWYEWLLLPLNIYGNIFLFFIVIALFSALILRFLNWMHPLKEGIFQKGSKDWKYMHRRFWTAYLPIWLARALPLPWMDVVCYNLFGTKVGKKVVAYEGYIDPFLVEIGDFTMTSLNTFIFSHLLYHDEIVIKRVKIGNYCIIGPQTLISPGTIMEKGAILGANSYTWVNQQLQSDLIHVGIPVDKSFPIQTIEKSREKVDKIRKKERESKTPD